MRLFFTTFIFCLLVNLTFAQTYKKIEIDVFSNEDIKGLMELGLAVDHAEKDSGTISFFASEDELRLLDNAGYSYNIIIEDWIEYYNSLPKMSEAEKQSQLDRTKTLYGVSGFNYGSMGGYFTLAEVWAELDEMFTDYPNLITEKASIGTTHQDRDIYYVKISDNPTVDENEPEVLYTALHHAREPESMMLLIYYMYYLLENYGIDDEVTYLIDNREIYFVPVVNPDGYFYNETTNPNGGGFWRKNRRVNGDGSYGVDLNRNYGPVEYWNAPNGGSSTFTNSETYRGPNPFSEPETSAIRDFIASREIKACLNYHTYSNLLIYPYGALEMETPDSTIFREYAQDMTQYNGYTTGTDQQTVGYSTRGNSDDFMYDGDLLSHGKIFAMTPEVGNSFWPPQSEIIPLAEENIYPNLYYAWAAGEYPEFVNYSISEEYVDPGESFEMQITLFNRGLSTSSNIVVELSSLSQYLTVNSGSINFDPIPSRTAVQSTLAFNVTASPSAPVGGNLGLKVVIKAGDYELSSDNITIQIGTPIIVFQDLNYGPETLWAIDSDVEHQWEATTSDFFSEPTSFTDSKNGDYAKNATVTMTLNDPVDLTGLTNPVLSFRTKYSFEANWDCGVVSVSTNGGSTWNQLSGNYTTAASGAGRQTPGGSPVYEGIQNLWVYEEMSLNNFLNKQIIIKFELRSDISNQRDGWYLDDIKVHYLGVVPVELTNFSGLPIEDGVLLNWQTATETNNKGFELERKLTGSENEWQKLTFIEGRGTTSEISNYEYHDKISVSGVYNYRLKQIDYDGTFTYSDVVEVDFTTVVNYRLSQNYPNPFNPETTIEYSIPTKAFVTLKLFNSLGEEIAVLVNKEMEAGNYNVNLNLDEFSINLSTGVYYYTISAGSFFQAKKMLYLK